MNHIPESHLAPLAPGAEWRASVASILPRAVLVWSVVACLTALNVLVAAVVNRAPLPSWRSFVPGLAEWYLWVLLTPGVLWLGFRFPFRRERSWVTYLAHAGGIVAASSVRGVVYTLTTITVARGTVSPTVPAYLLRVMLAFLPIAAILYGAILAAGAAIDYARRSRAGEVRAAQLETRLAQAELTALRANLHPHFLFNALHSVGALVRVHESDAAVRVIAELSELLRYLLRRDAPEEVALADELSFVRRYLAIEQVRFADRLCVHWAIAPGTEQAALPRLLLQPLVENAVRHGVARSSAAGRIVISACQSGPWLEVAVEDDGVGPPPASTFTNGEGGQGLTAIRARLRQAYGAAAGVTLERGPEGGAIARARLPFRLAAPSPARGTVRV